MRDDFSSRLHGDADGLAPDAHTGVVHLIDGADCLKHGLSVGQPLAT